VSEVSTALFDPEELEKYQVEESPRVGFGDCNKEQEFEGEKKDDTQEALMIHDDTIMMSLLALDDTTMAMLDLMLGGQR